MELDLPGFIQLLPEPAFLLSGSGVIAFTNHGMTRLLGIERGEVVGMHFEALVNEPPDRVREYLRLCSRSRQLVPGAFTWTDAKGNPIALRCDGAVLVPKTDTREATLLVRCRPKAQAIDQFAVLNEKITALSREIIERKKIQRDRDDLFERERAARLEAERVGRIKDEFLATLSHELRTPLSSILGWATLLQREGLTGEDVLRGVRTIERNARHQGRIIDDLLDMSGIIAGKVRLDVQTVDAAAMIQSAVESVRPAAEAKNIGLQVTVDSNAGTIKGDASRLQQIVWNLLSNAVKFTPRNGRVQFTLQRIDSRIEIIVADDGEGIAPGFLPHVFDRFVQADPSTTRRNGGLGLGLSIVKQLAELHGGSVCASSPGAGQGTCVTVCLPLYHTYGPADDAVRRPPQERPDSAFPDRPAGPELSGLCILIVDDEPDARELMRQILREREADVLTAASGADALEALVAHRPDILVCDIGMPCMDGYEVIRRVRALTTEAGGRTPALAVTAFAGAEDRTRSMLAGFNGYMSKPVEIAELVATVASLAGRAG